MKTKLLLFFCLCLSTVVLGQQEPQYAQYMYNSTIINPAYAGSRETLNVFLLHRSQWVGFDGAPKTTNLSVETPINENLGVAVSFLKDEIGPSVENDLSASISYGFYVSDFYRLSFGLKASVNLLDVDFSRTYLNDNNDYQFQTNIDNRFSPNVGVGVYLHSDRGYAGLSSPSLLKSFHFDRFADPHSDSFVVNPQSHVYFMGGYVFDLNDQIKFKPSLLTKFTSGAPVQVDISANFLFSEKFNAGLSYRFNAAATFLAGFQVTNSWFIGYSYDMETTRLVNYNSGSHELFLRYELFNKNNRYVISPRFF
jgi:type IX secretion system PorP/SprF family membrane protein